MYKVVDVYEYWEDTGEIVRIKPLKVYFKEENAQTGIIVKDGRPVYKIKDKYCVVYPSYERFIKKNRL